MSTPSLSSTLALASTTLPLETRSQPMTNTTTPNPLWLLPLYCLHHPLTAIWVPSHKLTTL